ICTRMQASFNLRFGASLCRAGVLLRALVLIARGAFCQDLLGDNVPVIDSPITKPASEGPPDKPNWPALFRQELRFLLIEHAFRWATEPGTRSGGVGWGSGYWNSLSNLHGWADGDPFYVNYLGHPIQGAVAGFIWQQNDGRYRAERFGRNPL